MSSFAEREPRLDPAGEAPTRLGQAQIAVYNIFRSGSKSRVSPGGRLERDKGLIYFRVAILLAYMIR